MANFVVLMTKGPFSGEAEWPFRFVDSALDNGHKVQVFLAENATWIAKKGQQYDVYPNLEEYIIDAISKGAEIKVCETCRQRRDLSEKDCLPGVAKGTMTEFIEAAAKADKVLTF
jgi:sulfur relay (sulfurtransferase) complex TusBCD TusD component (DsrE family)